MKRCIVSMTPKRSGLPSFELVVYGRSAADLMTIPNTVISTLAARYPGYQASPFSMRDAPPIRVGTNVPLKPEYRDPLPPEVLPSLSWR